MSQCCASEITSIHPSIFSDAFPALGLAALLDSVPAVSQRGPGQVASLWLGHVEKRHAIIHTHTYEPFVQFVEHLSLDCGRKPGVPGENSHARRLEKGGQEVGVERAAPSRMPC